MGTIVRRKLSLDLIERICNYLQNGCSREDACRLEGLDKRLLSKWSLGQDTQQFVDSLPYNHDVFKRATALYNSELPQHEIDEFLKTRKPTERRMLFTNYLNDKLKNAETAMKAEALSNIRTSMAKNWQASAWYLERKYSEEYALRTKADIQAKTNVKVVLATPRPKRNAPRPEAKRDNRDG